MFGTEKNLYGIKAVYPFKLFTNIIEKSLVLKRCFIIQVGPIFQNKKKCQPFILLSPPTSDPIVILQYPICL